MKANYVPPKQSTFGQFVDSILILLLVFGSLLTPLLLTSAEKTEEASVATTNQMTWESLQQNPTMVAQWEKLGHTPETAAPIIQDKFDYSIDPTALIFTFLVILGYYLFVLRTSEKEYREVIAERFGQAPDQNQSDRQL